MACFWTNVRNAVEDCASPSNFVLGDFGTIVPLIGSPVLNPITTSFPASFDNKTNYITGRWNGDGSSPRYLSGYSKEQGGSGINFATNNPVVDTPSGSQVMDPFLIGFSATADEFDDEIVDYAVSGSLSLVSCFMEVYNITGSTMDGLKVFELPNSTLDFTGGSVTVTLQTTGNTSATYGNATVLQDYVRGYIFRIEGSITTQSGRTEDVAFNAALYNELF